MGSAIRFYLSLVLLTALASVATGMPAMAAESKEGIMVGRITHVEGKLLRYIEEKKDWVVTVKDSPFGLEDALYSEEDAKAEFIMPNRTWLRMGENTQVQLIDLNPEATTLDVGSGLVRLYNRSKDAIVKATTPYGYVVASGDTVFDLYVGGESLEVIAIRGKVDFVQEQSNARIEVRSGSFSIIADNKETAKGNGTVDAPWDDWNGERDLVWNKRSQGRSYSAAYLPEPLRDEAYELDETGRWERVYYEGRYRDMWRPLRVERGWRPFTAGRWVSYYGDNCWIPDEPFGYVTHHYGSWIYVETRRCWYWVPPVTRVVASTPRFYLSFGWYPGRVGWIHRDTYIGWVPLAPYETYYCYRPWGYRAVVVNPTVSVNVGISFNLSSFLFINQAVVIHHDNFFSGTRYTPYLERNIGRNVIVNNYQPVTVINNTVINNYSNDFRRFAYSDAEVLRKPHGSVIDRIAGNQRIRSEFGSIGKERIISDMTRISSMAEPSGIKESHRLTVANKLVDPDKVNKSLDTLSLSRKELKGRERQVADSKLERRSTESGRGKNEFKAKKSGGDELSLQQGGVKHGGKEVKTQSGPQGGESKHGRKAETRIWDGGGGEKSAFEQTKSHKNNRQEGPQQEQRSISFDKGSGKHERAADRGGKQANREETWQVQEPRESGKRAKGHSGRQQDEVRQLDFPQHQQQAEVQGHKGGGKHGWQDEGAMAQEQHGKGRGGKN